MEPTGKEAYELKKKERENARGAGQNKNATKGASKKFVKHIAWALIFIAIIYGIYVLIENSKPQTPDLSISYEILGREHIENGSRHPEYNSNPPSSGWHYVTPAPTGFYDGNKDVPSDEQIVHNLEHGDIWIAYHPRVSEAIKKQLKSFTGGKVIVTVREDNDTDIASVAWGRVDSFNIDGELDERRIKDFITRYINKGPERVNSSVHSL